MNAVLVTKCYITTVQPPIIPQPFIPDLKLIRFTNPFIHSLSGATWTVFMDFWTWTGLTGHWSLFVLVSSFTFFVFGYRIYSRISRSRV